MSDLLPRPPSHSSAFLTSEELRKEPEDDAALALPDPQDKREIRLLLRGESIIDWHRLAYSNEAQVRRLLRLNSIDPDDPRDLERLGRLRAEAVRYIHETLGLRLDDHIASGVPFTELPLIASGEGKHQRHACVLLKVMHILYHIDARELLTALSIPDNELFSLVEASVVRMFDELRGAGVPVVEFAWSRKSRESLITKLLLKRETSAARVFDRLRFRLVVERPEDIIPTLRVMLHRCIPFNYVLPGQTVNSLLGADSLQPLRDATNGVEENEPALTQANELSSESYRILNFVADLPVRVDDLLNAKEKGRLRSRGHVVFVLAEFQIMDQGTADTNETGDSAHVRYKHRQHQSVRERLLREPKQPANNGQETSPSDE